MPPTSASPSPSASVRGWCPSVHSPMSSGDGWLVRARTGCRTVTSEQWRALAVAARRFGSGLAQLTSRGNVQVRGVHQAELAAVAAVLVGRGVAPASPAMERARCVVSSPTAGYGRSSSAGAGAAVAAIESALASERFARLPAKWWAVVDDGSPWPLAGLRCDVRVRPAGSSWAVEVAGAPLGLADDPVRVVVEVAGWSAATGRRGRELPSDRWRRRLQLSEPAPPEVGRARWVGAAELSGAPVSVAAPFLGTCTADDLELLADLADDHQVVVRPTTERGVAICGGSARGRGACRDALGAAGWIVDPSDPRDALSACVGRRGCAAALVDTDTAARRLVADGVTWRTHLSGCAKACGAPTGVRHLVATGPGSFEVVP